MPHTEVLFTQVFLQSVLFTHLVHRTWGVYSTHFPLFLVLFDNWFCGLQVGLNSASKRNKLGYWGQMIQGDSEETQIRSKNTHVGIQQLKWVGRVCTSQMCRRMEPVHEIINSKRTTENLSKHKSFCLRNCTFSPNFPCCHLCVRCFSLFLDIFRCTPVDRRWISQCEMALKWRSAKNSTLWGFRHVRHCCIQRKAQIWHLLCRAWRCSSPGGCPRFEGNRLWGSGTSSHLSAWSLPSPGKHTQQQTWGFYSYFDIVSLLHLLFLLVWRRILLCLLLHDIRSFLPVGLWVWRGKYSLYTSV